MKPVCYWALALSASAAVAVARDINTAVPKRFIVEVDEHLPLGQRSFTRSLDSIYSSIQDIQYEVHKEFSSKGIFSGAVLALKNPEDAIKIRNTPGVRSVRPVRQYSQPKPVASHIVTGVNDPQLPPDTQSTHVMTGVDKLHAKGIIGTGIKIGIIDTGVDYNHPALGGGIGPGHKFIGGYDFVGDAFNGTDGSQPVPDDDPLDNCGTQSSGHGTHVSGIIGANPGNIFNISGVAYGASLTFYKIFGCTGGTSDDIIIQALLRGVQDGQDILTLSLGSSEGWTESSAADVADRIAASGKVVTIAAGNDGASGGWFTSSPGNAIHAISVGSVDNTVFSLQNATVHGVDHEPIPYYSIFPFATNQTLPVYATSNDTTVADDACNPLPASTPDLSPFIVVVRRGSCAFHQKIANIAAKGAKLALFYNNVPGFISVGFGNFTGSLIQDVDGAFLVQQFAAGAPISLSFPQDSGVITIPEPNGGLVSSFSSYGPTNDFFLKPAVSAPGGNILSTFPAALGDYGLLSGTSMATPFVAGSAALLLETRGKTAEVAKAALSLFESTARKVPSNNTDADPLQTLAQQGAGLINAFDAVYTTTILSPTELILNDTANFAGLQYFTVQNTGDQAGIYTLKHVPAGTALTIKPGSISPALGPVPLSAVAATVEIIPSTLALAPGETQTVAAMFTPPTGLDASTYPVYSGFIEVTSESGTVHVSYLGLVGNLKDKQIIDNTTDFFGFQIPAITNPNTGAPQVNPINYTFVGNDYPALLWRLVFGTPSLDIDLVDATTDITNINDDSFAQIKTIGNLTSFTYLPRNTEDPQTEGGSPFNTFNLTTPAFANGSIIENGSYRILMRALRVTADPEKEESYESWLSPIFGIQA